MSEIERAAAIRGRTMRWSWTEGPTRGETHEHRFGEDGTVTWRRVKPEDTSRASASPEDTRERATYAAVRLTGEIYLVSYLAPSGFTLTVAVDLATGSVAGFASGADAWFPVRGTSEIVDAPG